MTSDPIKTGNPRPTYIGAGVLPVVQWGGQWDSPFVGARRSSARAVNAVMTAAYWEIGRRVVEFEQRGKRRAEYGEELIVRLSADLVNRFGRGFGISQVKMMRQFYLAYPQGQKGQPAIGRSEKSQSLIGQSISPSSEETAFLRQFIKIWHDSFHVAIEQWHGETIIAVGGAVNHSLANQCCSSGCDSLHLLIQ